MRNDSGRGYGDNRAGRGHPQGPQTDYGPMPFVVNTNEAARENDFFRRALWTGNNLQMTLMSIPPGGEIGVERHPRVDQFIRIEHGQGQVKMGRSRENWELQRTIGPGFGFFIPAGTWHNLINTGRGPLKLSSIYAPPQHPWGTVQKTREEAMAQEYDH